jgi:iron complex outermembrane receptor protein
VYFTHRQLNKVYFSKTLFQTCVSISIILFAQPEVWARERTKIDDHSQLQNLYPLSQNDRPQVPTEPLIQITGVKLNPTAAGIEVVLESNRKTTALPTTRTEGNTFIAELQNTVLTLPQGERFQVENPSAGVTSVSVTQIDATTVRVSVVGEQTTPTATVTLSPSATAQQLEAPEEGEEELVVTEQQRGYRVPNASTATKTDTPIRDIPASIQVIPREIIQDQAATNVKETLRNVSGITYSSSSGNRSESFILRGFDAQQFENGFRNDFFSQRTERDLANIEQVEVLKGPASILFGRLEPSGVVNFVTKQPLRDPLYDLSFTAGSYSFYRPTADLSGPLTADKNLAYRFNIAYENAGSFRDRVQSERIFLAPTLSWQISPDTKLSFEVTHLRDRRPIDRGIVVLSNNQIADIPISRVLGDPTQQESFTESRATLALEHRFNPNLSLKSAFRYSNATENGPGCTLQIFGPSEDDQNFPVSECFGRQDYNRPVRKLNQDKKRW